ncbi:MAG: TraX family protein [Eubacteriales bacterium]|nr:TraX family protein [Eubacteriales bacterium]
MDTGMGRRGVVWKTPDITADGLKIFACIVMLIQTAGIAIVENGLIHIDEYTQAELSKAMAEDSGLMTLAGVGSVMQLLGGLAIPIFAFLLVEGFLNTSDYRKYLLSMAVFALLSEIPYDLAMSQSLVDWSGQNGLVTMCISLLMLYFLQMFKDRKGFAFWAVRILIVFASVVWVTLFRAQYGLCIVLLTAIFYLFYTRNVLKTVLGILVSLLYVTGPLAFYGIWCYTGVRRNKLPKYAYYAFYPLHLLVLGLAGKFLL